MSKSSLYYFIKDIIRCIPSKLGTNFVYVSNHHLISKKIIRIIFKDEIKEKKPEYKILINILIIQYDFLNSLSRAAIYEVIEIVDELKYCIGTKFKTVRKKGSAVVISLFSILYFEYILMPGRRNEGKEYLDKFRKTFSREDMIEVINTYGPLYGWIFEKHGIDLGTGEETLQKLPLVLDRFYSTPIE